jgi:hypothetical protein
VQATKVCKPPRCAREAAGSPLADVTLPHWGLPSYQLAGRWLVIIRGAVKSALTDGSESGFGTGS